MAMITQKSIIMAKRDRKHIEQTGADGMSWKRYPVSPRDKKKNTEFDDTPAQRAMQEEMEVESMLAKDKEHREGFTKQMVQYYKDVRVCGTCFKVYTTFDWAREILGKSDAHGAGEEREAKGESSRRGGSSPGKGLGLHKLDSASSVGGSSTASVSGGVRESKSPGRSRSPNRGRKGKGGGKQGLNSTVPGGNMEPPGAFGEKREFSKTAPMRRDQSQSVSPERKGGSPSPNRKNKGPNNDDKGNKGKNDKRTWKDYKERPGAKNHGEFADLDDYLRVGSDTLAQRKIKEKEAFMRKRVQQLHQNEGSDQVSLV